MAMLHKKYPQVSKEVLISVYRGGERNNNNNNILLPSINFLYSNCECLCLFSRLSTLSRVYRLTSSILTVNVFVYLSPINACLSIYRLTSSILTVNVFVYSLVRTTPEAENDYARADAELAHLIRTLEAQRKRGEVPKARTLRSANAGSAKSARGKAATLDKQTQAKPAPPPPASTELVWLAEPDDDVALAAGESSEAVDLAALDALLSDEPAGDGEARALYDYAPDKPEKLPFRKGDLVLGKFLFLFFLFFFFFSFFFSSSSSFSSFFLLLLFLLFFSSSFSILLLFLLDLLFSFLIFI